jgi:hypothetical protein
MSVATHTRVPVDGIEAWICDWVGPGVLVWIRKTHFTPVAGTTEQRAAVGAFVRDWLDLAGGRPTREAFAPSAGANRQEEAAADGPVYTIHDVVADMRAACPVGPNGQRAADFTQPQWKQYGKQRIWGWGRRWPFLAPNGELAELSTEGSPERVLEFLRDWDLHSPAMAQRPWGSRPSKQQTHITFELNGAMRHYRGLYFRWKRQDYRVALNTRHHTKARH